MIAEIIFSTALMIPDGYLPADGRCLSIKYNYELAKLLHKGSEWPYGLCSPRMFRLPNLKSNYEATPLIKVR